MMYREKAYGERMIRPRPLILRRHIAAQNALRRRLEVNSDYSFTSAYDIAWGNASINECSVSQLDERY